MTNRLSYAFNADRSELTGDPVEVLGGKGHSLAVMTEAGFPVPPGFTLTTEACRAYLADGWTDQLESAVIDELATLERTTAKQLGSATTPLLASVRSGASVSMPGMMDTVLNVGMNPTVAQALANLSGDSAFAADTYRRALLSYSEIVLGAPSEVLDAAVGSAEPTDLEASLRAQGFVVPTDPMAQLVQAVRAVFESWNAPRAARYRAVEGIDESLGTAVTVQAMVFGNLGDRSGTGVAFSRNPTTGERGLMGDFLFRAQGEEVVAGTSITEQLEELRRGWPDVHADLELVADRLESHYRDMVDIEFTVEQDRLWMLQARRGKRSPIAAFRIAIDMVEDSNFPLDRVEAVERCQRYFDDPPRIISVDERGELPVAATGLAASPGSGSGVLVVDPDQAVEYVERGIDVVLARQTTSPADVHGMAVAKGLFTTLGGLVSHAALVAREWGIPAVVGATEAQVVDGAVLTPAGRLEVGTVVTVDGEHGQLLLGQSTVEGVEAPEVTTVRSWAADMKKGAADESVSADDTDDTIDLDDELDFRALHALRIKGMADAETIAELVGVDAEAIRPRMQGLVSVGAATFMEPRDTWLLSAEGRDAHGPALAAAVAAIDVAAIPYDRFLELNGRFKKVCTDWQLRNGEPNDHSDADYDQSVLHRFATLDDEAGPILDAVGAAVPWMGRYRARLTAARLRVENGDPKALTGVMCSSYHDVWMELHEDLILTQGIDREAEGSF